MQRLCEVNGCVRPHLAKGYCKPHYRRWKKFGDPNSGQLLPEEIEALEASPNKKYCLKCQQVKPLEDFPVDKRYRKGRKSNCRKCTSEYIQTWASTKPPRKFTKEQNQKSRERVVKREYGMTWVEYQEFVAKNKKCHICGAKAGKGQSKGLVVDHCHASKKVRGMLCRNCNLGLGFFQDSTLLLSKARRYLKGGG